jgi:hypothetical protein
VCQQDVDVVDAFLRGVCYGENICVPFRGFGFLEFENVADFAVRAYLQIPFIVAKGCIDRTHMIIFG